MSDLHDYALRIDGSLLRSQRQWLLRLANAVLRGIPYLPESGDQDLLEGVISLCDEIADQAHDQYGIDCLLEAPPEVDESRPDDDCCECE